MSDYSTDDFLGYGTILAMGNSETPSEEFTKVAKVQDIDGPNQSVDTVESTTHDSPDYTKEYLMGLIDNGDISFPINYNAANSTHDATTGLEKVFNDRKKVNWKIIFPIPGPIGFWGLSFKAGITKFNRKAPVNGIISADISMKISGKVSLEDIDVSTLC